MSGLARYFTKGCHCETLRSQRDIPACVFKAQGSEAHVAREDKDAFVNKYIRFRELFFLPRDVNFIQNLHSGCRNPSFTIFVPPFIILPPS